MPNHRRNDSKTHSIALSGLLFALAMALSFVEGTLVLPGLLPGMKLGLANIVVMYALFLAVKCWKHSHLPRPQFPDWDISNVLSHRRAWWMPVRLKWKREIRVSPGELYMQNLNPPSVM